MFSISSFVFFANIASLIQQVWTSMCVCMECAGIVAELIRLGKSWNEHTMCVVWGNS